MPVALSPAMAPGLQEALEDAGRNIDRLLHDDRNYPDLSEQLSVPAPGEPMPVMGGNAWLVAAPPPPRLPRLVSLLRLFSVPFCFPSSAPFRFPLWAALVCAVIVLLNG